MTSPPTRYARACALALAATFVAATLVAAGTPAGAATKGATMAKVAQAKVPRLCEHPAGRMVDGTLPGIPEMDGGVTLNRTLVAFGSLRKGQARSAAAVIECNRGGVGWPSNVVVYSPSMKVVGTFRLGSITHGAREHVRKIWISKRVIHVQVANITAPDDAGCCGTWSANLTMKWSAKKHRVVLTSKHIYTERAVLNKLVQAANKNDRKTALRYADAAVVSNLMSLRKQGFTLKAEQCFGDLSDWSDYLDGVHSRGCWLSGRYDEIGFGAVLFFDQTGWRTWKAVKMVDYPSGE